MVLKIKIALYCAKVNSHLYLIENKINDFTYETFRNKISLTEN